MDFSSITLACFTTVANLGSIAAASAKLDVAGSVLSRNIKRMEDVLGVALFERSPKGMRLTPAGEQFAAYIRRARIEQDEVLRQIRQRSHKNEGHLRIAATAGLTLSLVPRILAAYRKLHPRVTFELTSRPQPEIFTAVERGDVDFGVTFEGRIGTEVQFLHREVFKSYAVMAPDHPLARMSDLTLQMLAQYPLTGSSQSSTRALQERVWSMAGVSMSFMLQTNNTAAMYSYCRHSDAINFSAYPSFFEFVERGHLVARSFEGHEHMQRSVVLSTLQGRKVSGPLQALLEVSVETLRALVGEQDRAKGEAAGPIGA